MSERRCINEAYPLHCQGGGSKVHAGGRGINNGIQIVLLANGQHSQHMDRIID